ncbi:alpha/beta fold hydrolase [Kribbella sp. NPDC004875]|uniref:alpha/beta fold hydrolase n=1 Tax=Kribbella sp. NPDC004875 TaxID=3364107 RepID=UPI0036B473FC
MNQPVRLRLSQAVINCSVSGTGPPVLLLHGWPQTRHAWRHVAPLLEQEFTVVVPDLPGFGASSRHLREYDKVSVAQVMHELMQLLGFETFHVVGHDVGGQVAYPLAAKFPDAVRSVTLVEAGIPGLGGSEHAANPLLGGSWHFGFNMVPDLPELLITGRERAYLEFMFRRDSIGLFVTDAIDDDALAHYARALAAPGALRAVMGYYRSLPIDLSDNKRLSRDTPLTMPVNVIGARYGVGLTWLESVAQAAAVDVSTYLVERSGHYVPEEQPAELAAVLVTILSAKGGDNV